MKDLSFIFILTVFFALTSCQVKETSSSGGLVSGHTPTTNSFTVSTPTADTYVTADVLSINLSFPFAVTVTGTPRLELTVGATTRYADYVSGDGTTTLLFQYTIVGADNDSNGVALVDLELNGGTLTFDLNGVPTNCSTASVTARTWSNVKVDNTSATITAFALTNSAGFYHKDLDLSFTMTFSEAVYVTGTPRFALDFTTGGPVYATYAGGSGTTVLSFTYTIDNTVADTNGYDSITSPLDLNSGTIKDLAGNDAGLVFAAYTAAVITYSATVDFNGLLPYVVDVTPPANATYVAGQALDFTVEFDRNVNVTGSPYLGLTISGGARQATYLSGTGTNLIVFRYNVVPGDVDADGITVASTITANGGTIIGSAAPLASYFTIAANNSFTSPVTTGLIVNAIQPQATSVSRGTDTTNPSWGAAVADNVWKIGQTLLITVGFNTGMTVDQTGGVPRIPLTIGVSTQYATYLSGGNGQTSLTFQYVIQEGDLDADASIGIGSIDLNGGSITDSANTNTLLTLPQSTLTTTTIDGVKPTVSSVAKPADGTYSTITGNNHLVMTFTVTWSEAVNYSTSAVNVPLTIGVTAVNATLASGNNTTTLVHRASSLAGYTDTDGIAVSSPLTGTATIKDRAGNTATVLTFAPPVTTGILVDTTAPTISSVTPPAADTYSLGETLDFAVNYSEVVNVTSSGGYPRIALAFDSGTRYATYSSGSGTSTINFQYTIVASDSDLNGITNPTSVSIANAPTAYVRDLGQNGGTTTSYAFTTNLAGIVVDALAPSISSRTIPANGTYDSGDALTFTTTFNEIVTVTGTPQIQVAAQTGTLNFDYVGGSGSTTLTFTYTVTGNDFDFDGLPSSVTTIALNGGTIQDAALNDASLTFTAANLSSVFLAYPDTIAWTTSSFTNRSAIAGLTLTSGGTVSTEACGTGTCRTFNGDDTLTTSGAMTNVETIFIVFKTPAALANLDLFDTDVSVVDDGVALDLSTANASINLDGATSSGVSHDVNMSTASTHILQVDYTANQSYGAGVILPSTYLGAVGEVIIINSVLTNAQKTEILNYLNSKY